MACSPLFADLSLDDAMRAFLRRLSTRESGCLREGAVREELAKLAEGAAPVVPLRGAILTTTADGSKGATAEALARWESSSELQIAFTGYVPPGTPAARLVGTGRATYLRWNVHPRLSDNVDLARSVGARAVIPAFCELKFQRALKRALAPAQVTVSTPASL